MKKNRFVTLACTAILLSGCGKNADNTTPADLQSTIIPSDIEPNNPSSSNTPSDSDVSNNSDHSKDSDHLTDSESLAKSPDSSENLSGSDDSENPDTSGNIANISINASDMFTDRDSRTLWDASSAIPITLSGQSAECNSSNVSIKENKITITAEGTYILSGTLSDGMIIVDTDKNSKVQLILNGVSIQNSSSAALYIRSADKVFVTLADRTVNTLSNGGTYTEIDDNNIDAAIFSKDDLTLNGNGSLIVQAAAGHGIVSKNDLVFTGGTYTINAASHGLCGKDSVRVADGIFTITSGKDGIQSDNSDDTDKGFVYIKDGVFQITTAGDGISASKELLIDGGDFTITAGGGYLNAASHKGQDFDRFFNQTSSTETLDSTSMKGIKCDGAIGINSGTFQIDSADDGLHSNSDLLIYGGTFSISTGDDGIHADSSVQITDGLLDIIYSYEGIEGKCIDISGGTIDILSADDGINAAGGNDSSGFGGFFGRDQFSAQEGTFLNISGGLIHIDASGDGIDSNGTLTVSGGEIYVDGPENSGNGALDTNGEAAISGGIVVAAGASGMAETFSTSSTQGCILLTFDTWYPSGTTIELFDTSDSTASSLLNYSPSKSFNSVVVSCPEIKLDNTYTIRVGSYETTITMTEISYGSNNGFQAPGKNQRPGGGKKQKESNQDGNFQNPPDGTTPPDGDFQNPPDGIIPPDGNFQNPPDGIIPPDNTAPSDDNVQNPPDDTVFSNDSSYDCLILGNTFA